MNTNPPGQWRQVNKDLHQFESNEISAVYGLIRFVEENRLGSDFNWYWQARVIYPATSSSGPPHGYAPTFEAAKTIVETILHETNTCERGVENEQRQ